MDDKLFSEFEESLEQACSISEGDKMEENKIIVFDENSLLHDTAFYVLDLGKE